MPLPNCLFPEEKILPIFEANGVEVVERSGDIVIWGSREIGKDFPVRFLAARQFSPGVWDIYTIRNLLEELELDEDVCEKIDSQIFGYTPADQQD